MRELSRPYLIGFAGSFVLTFTSYFLVTDHLLTGTILTASIVVLALVQMSVQLIFFLHILNGPKPRWNLLFTLATLVTIGFIFVASLWIMYNLNQSHQMTPNTTNDQIIKDENIHTGH